MAKKQNNNSPVCKNKFCQKPLHAEGGAQYVPLYKSVRRVYICTDKKCPDYLIPQLETQEPVMA